MTVTILSLSARGAESVAVTFELRCGEQTQRESFLLSPAQVADLGLCRGESNQACYDAVSTCARIYEAKKRGVILLGYGGCSEQALCRKLVAKGISREIAHMAVAELVSEGYVDPTADALREAERCVAKEWGKRRIVATLRAKGYADEAIRAAMYALEDAEVDFVALCAERIQKQVGVVPSEPAARQKLFASLERYGFSSAEIREAMRRLAEPL